MRLWGFEVARTYLSSTHKTSLVKSLRSKGLHPPLLSPPKLSLKASKAFEVKLCWFEVSFLRKRGKGREERKEGRVKGSGFGVKREGSREDMRL